MKNRKRIAIDMDSQGLVEVQSITCWVIAQLAYYSLELLLSHELITETDSNPRHKYPALVQSGIRLCQQVRSSPG